MLSHLDPRTLRFLGFTAFSIVALLAGYTARRRGWLREEAARPIHFHTVLWFWSTGGVLSLWLLPLSRQLLWFLLIVPVSMMVAVYVTIPLARWIGCTRPQIGVMAIGAGISNGGVTLGAYLCYCLIGPDHAAALGIAGAYCSLQLILAVPLLYPVALHFSTDGGSRVPITRTIVSSIIDVRSIGLFAGVVGIALSAARVPFPQWIQDCHILDVLFYLCALGGYLGVGLRLRLGDSLHHKPQHALLAAVKFGLIPLICYALICLIGGVADPLPAMVARTVVVQSLIPAGVSIVILANLFHLDARLASVLWVWNTALFLLIPLPVILWYFH